MLMPIMMRLVVLPRPAGNVLLLRIQMDVRLAY